MSSRSHPKVCLLLFGRDISEKFIKYAEDLLTKLFPTTVSAKLLSLVGNFQPLLAEVLPTDAENNAIALGDVLIIIVAHSSLTVEGDGTPSYIGRDELSWDNLIQLRDSAYACWVCGCSATNIDVSTTDRRFHADSLGELRRVNPFSALYYSSSYCTPFMSTYLFIAFIEVAHYYGIEWWTMNSFYTTLSRISNALPSSFIEAMVRRATDYKLGFDDQVLRPSYMSFPEVLHLAMFKAIDPSHGGLYHSKNEKQAWGKLHPCGQNANDFWLPHITGQRMLNLAKAKTDFFYGEGPKLSVLLRECLEQGFKNPRFVLPGRDVLIRMLCCGLPLYEVAAQPAIAIVCRVSEQDGDSRMRVGAKDFKDAVISVCELAKKYDWKVVMMDKYVESIWDIIAEVDPVTKIPILDSEDLTGHWEDRNRNKRNVLEQFRYLYGLVKSKRITAAVGIHGGILDALNMLGVEPRKTVHMLGKVDPNGNDRLSRSAFGSAEEKNGGWKSRTWNVECVFHGLDAADKAFWGTPSKEQLENLFN